mmetsp:Transcript_6199/g.11720  ORF Transcript_6199/g.11720 Transcript_6199/m.11720 type:complete len:109 (-) Transcript_6199:159-485(-)
MLIRLEQIILFVVWFRFGCPSHPLAFVDAQSCVGTYDNRYICTDDAAKVHSHLSGSPSSHLEHLGIEQSVIGSKEEIEGIKEVIMKMQEYMLNEVLAKPEYEGVRDKW